MLIGQLELVAPLLTMWDAYPARDSSNQHDWLRDWFVG